ncbi:unnamed protein product [Rotaria sp. Silwood1]|nr:unnamed protein product [Rotaria sp. Silwood1]CAF0747667.1 unnamed protein product [Rotaria sp. Silwood1]CAF3335642.1 unnamed protein product [Rotaria sp. Silwood1]CAF4671439.1 unnamed protein product [Rotaria sp. Silwood1]
MADEFDPLKQTADKPAEKLYTTIQKNTENTDDDLLRPQVESIAKTGHHQTNTSTEQKSQENVYQKLDHTQNAPKAPIRSTNPFEEDAKKASPAFHATQQLPQEQTRTTVSEPRREPRWQDSQGYYDQDYDTTQAQSSYANEYYEDSSLHKKKGFFAVMDRLVQRFPTLSIFYKPSTCDSSEVHGGQYEDEYVEEVESDEAPQLVDANQLPRELTADELALNERYSNKLRTQIIDLQVKDHRQPIDVCIHHESYTLYSCDVGRSIVEIFDMYGKLQHTINDQAMTKFQPTAIAVAYDGTVILASHFHHCLYMYSPTGLQETEDAAQNETLYDGYHFKQYKLGSPGHDLHQFHHPAGIAIDYNDGYLYICDRGNFRIQVMRPEGVCERVIDLIVCNQEEEEYQINPIQIAHQQSTEQIVCIVDQGNALCFIPKDADGPTYVEPFYILDSNGLGLEGASGIAVDSNDRIFISDTGHHRIVICTPEGGYITHFGVEGTGPGELKRPCGLDITVDGTVIVADSGNKRLQFFGSIREQTIEENQSSIKKSDDKYSS